MQESLLTPWATFYTIVGSAAATLTGLMFVVITLVTGARARRPDVGIATFSTPSVVHFCGALAVAAILGAPWHVLWHAGLLVGLSGLVGLAYSGVIVRRIRRQDDYRPVLEDWLWHVVFPLVSYVALVVSAMVLPGNPGETLFIIGAATMLLLFIGIHNAWDNVTYIVTDLVQPPVEDPDEGSRGNVPKEEHASPLQEEHDTPLTTASSTGAPHE
jgi:hypothetical protein